MEQKFSAPLRGEQMGHETAGATASKAPESQNLTSVIAQEWKKPPPGEMKLELLSQQSRDRSSGTAASSQLSVCKLNFNTFITNSSPAQMEWIFHGVTAGLHQPHSGAEQSQSSTCTPSRVWDIPSCISAGHPQENRAGKAPELTESLSSAAAELCRTENQILLSWTPPPWFPANHQCEHTAPHSSGQCWGISDLLCLFKTQNWSSFSLLSVMMKYWNSYSYWARNTVDKII